MPPRQVYGKRATAKTTATYAQFISPDKDVPIVKDRKKNAAKKPAKTAGKDDVAAIEQEPVNLDLVDKDCLIMEVEKKKRGRSRRVVKSEGRAKEPKKEDELIDLMEDLGALNLTGMGSKDQRDKEQVGDGKLRKSLKTTSAKQKANTVSKDNMTRDQQTPGSHLSTVEQTPPFTPVRSRRRKEVMNPEGTLSPKMQLSLTPDTTPAPENPYASYVAPLLSLSYGKKIITFEDWSFSLEPHFEVTKIAEASFSEVYRLTATSTTSGSTNESVLKLVALRTPPDAPLHNTSKNRESRDPDRQAKKALKVREEKDQWKSQVEDVLSEVKLLQNLNDIPGFTNFRELTILQGRPSATFIDAWKTWNKSRPRGKKSEFPDPSKKTSYEDAQLWAVIEMQDAGTDCEKVMEQGGMNTIWEVWDVFWGVCLSVAKAEETCKFEHRDLHLENICIRSSRSQSKDDLTKPIIQDPLRRKLGFTGLDTTVIDYTLSRADIIPLSPDRQSSSSLGSITSASSSCDLSTAHSEPEVAFLDLNKDMGLFTGDATEEYQYEIYRYMRGAVFYNDPLKTSSSFTFTEPDIPRRSPRKTAQHIKFDEEGSPLPRRSPRKSMTNRYCDPPSSIWKSFYPKTNLIWAHFILHKLLGHLQGGEPADLSSKLIMRNVEARVEDTAKVAKKAGRLWKVLDRVKVLLEPGTLREEGSLGSVKELVVLAMEERWLRVEDVTGE